jgi:hypothetical protein
MCKVIILGMVALLLAGCGEFAKQGARSVMKESKAAYKTCLEQHPDDASACEMLKNIYETDLEGYRSLIAGTGLFGWPK